MRKTCAPLNNVTRSTKLCGAHRSPELAFRKTDFHVPKNLYNFSSPVEVHSTAMIGYLHTFLKIYKFKADVQ